MQADIVGQAKAQEVLDQQRRIVHRRQSIEAAWSASADNLRQELERDFDIRFVYESNAIEYVETTFDETREFLEAATKQQDLSSYMFASGVRDDSKLLEVVGHGGAMRFVRDLAAGLDGRRLREVDVRGLHQLAMAAEPRIAGRYKDTDNEIGGRRHLLTARADDVGARMHELVEWLGDTSLQGPLVAAVVHAWLADIHPFEDGNGRVARLLSNYVLLRYRWPSLIIRAGPDRQRYYEALEQSDYGDIGPLFSLVVEALHRGLSEMENPDFARSLLHRDLARQDAYENWQAMLRRFLGALREEFRLLHLDLDVVGYLQPSDFAWLQRRDASGNGWWAKVRSPGAVDEALLWFGYRSDALMGSTAGERPTPSIFISERDRSPASIHPYRPLWDDDDLAVGEIALEPTSKRGRVLVRRSQLVSTQSVPEAAKSLASALAQFFRTRIPVA